MHDMGAVYLTLAAAGGVAYLVMLAIYHLRIKPEIEREKSERR